MGEFENPIGLLLQADDQMLITADFEIRPTQETRERSIRLAWA